MAELIKTTDSLNDGRKKLNDAITDSNAALSTANTAKQTANLAKAESESTQTQLDTIVIEGDSSVEAAQARVNNSGTAFPTLKQRLDAEHQEVTAQLQQMEITTLKSFRERTVSVSEFGAVGDDETDDTNAIQNTVNYLGAMGGGQVLLPRGVNGKHVITKGIKWLSGVSIVGVGSSEEHGSGLVHRGSLFSAIYNTDGASNGDDGNNPDVWLRDCRFENFYIDGEGLTYPYQSADGKGIFILYMIGGKFRDVVIKNTIGTGFGCDFLIDTTFDSCVADNCGRNWTPGGVGQSGIGIGTGAEIVENVTIVNCTARNCGNYGFFVETQQPTDDTRSLGAKFIGCHAENNRINFGNKGSGGTQFNSITSFGGEYGLQLTEGSYGDRLTDVAIKNASQIGLYITEDYVGDLQGTNITIEDCRKNFVVEDGNSELRDVHFNSLISRRSQFSGMELGRPMRGFKLAFSEIRDNAESNTPGSKQGILLKKNITDFQFVANTFEDKRETKKQLIGLQALDNIKLKDGNFAGNDFSSYSIANSLQIFDGPTRENVRVSDNLGLNVEQTGKGQLVIGANYVQINFPTAFPYAPKVMVQPNAAIPIYITDITRFGFMARVTTSQALAFDWTAWV